jgi:hypothetical protein
MVMLHMGTGKYTIKLAAREQAETDGRDSEEC